MGAVSALAVVRSCHGGHACIVEAYLFGFGAACVITPLLWLWMRRQERRKWKTP